MYDIDLIYSWTPRQFKNFIKGAQLRTVDEYELAAAIGLFTAKASNSKKRLKLKDIYDADKVRKNMEKSNSKKNEVLSLDRYKKAKEAMKNYSPSMN